MVQSPWRRPARRRPTEGDDRGVPGHALTGGRRDFTSYRSIEASEYAVTVDAELAAEASRLLEKLP